MTTALAIARYLHDNKSLFGAMQLQKLLYYSQAWSLAWTGKTLFNEEIEAWKNGPVVRSVYAWGKYGGFASADTLSPEAQALVDAVYEFYGRKDGSTLSDHTHQELPWLEAREGLSAGAASTKPLSQATMRRYFTKLSMSGAEQPVRPNVAMQASDETVRQVVSAQRARWREALDELALT